MTKAFFSWSGGKDSLLALQAARAQGYDIHALLVMMDESGARSRSHGISPDLMKAQAASLGIPLTMVSAGWENYEDVFVSHLKIFAQEGITHGIFGDIDLQPHRDWEERVCAQAGLQAYLPLWGQPRKVLTQSFLELGYQATVVCVNGDFLDSSFVGRPFDAQFLADLPDHVDACGENGEFHTFVTAGPCFQAPLLVRVEKVYSHSVALPNGSARYHYAQLVLEMERARGIEPPS